MQGNNPATIEIGDTYNDLGVIVTDNVDHNLGHKIFVNDTEVSEVSLDTASSTTYTIRYESTDQAGNIGYAERVVIVGSGTAVSAGENAQAESVDQPGGNEESPTAGTDPSSGNQEEVSSTPPSGSGVSEGTNENDNG